MSLRIRIDNNGMRVSKPGYGVDDGFSALLLDASLRAGQFMNSGTVSTPGGVDGQATPPATVTFGIGSYAQIPDILIFGIKQGVVEFPPVNYNTFGPSTKYAMRISPTQNQCTVQFFAAAAASLCVWPDAIVWMTYRKPRAS